MSYVIAEITKSYDTVQWRRDRYYLAKSATLHYSPFLCEFPQATIFKCESDAEKVRFNSLSKDYFEVITLEAARHFEALGRNRLVRNK
jgi:hypothetical protein